MKREKGFTLVELLAVIILIGVLAIIAIPAVSKYLIASKDTTYSSFEKSMETAAQNRLIDCISNNEQCELPDSDEEQKMFLELLIEEGYLENLKDPDGSDFCKEKLSYVSIKGTESNDYNYTACLYCGSYETDNVICSKRGEMDAEDPVCGTINGASTRWTNQNRTISVGCSDVSSGCESSSFTKTFNKTTPKNSEGKAKGYITIRDKSGRTKSCEVDAYVDKTLPTCKIEVDGEYASNVGWYLSTATARIVDINDTDSGILSYGMGTSIKNRDYNKKGSLIVGNGITTVLGYTKDIAGNEGVCSKEVRVGIDVPKFNLFYGYRIFPEQATYTLNNIEENGSNYTTTSDSPKIIINNLSRYKDVEIVKITLNSEIETSTTATIKSGSMTREGLMQQGSDVIDFIIPKGTYNSFEITLGQINGATYNINKIEVLTKDGSTWTNQNIELYVESMDEGVRSLQVSYDNGITWSNIFHKTFSSVVESSVIVKNTIGLQSDSTAYKTNIDKSIPTVSVVAKKKTSNGNVLSGNYANEGLNYTFSKNNVGASGAQVYYCKDTANTCTPNTEVGNTGDLASYNNETTNYYIRYMITNATGTKSELSTYVAKFDTVKPQCSISSVSDLNITHDVTATITCTDTLSGLINKTITASDFTLSNNNLSIESVSQSAVSDGIEISLTLRGAIEGSTTLTFKSDALSDNASNYIDPVTKTYNIKGSFNIALNNQNPTTPGTANIYEKYGVGWYSNSGYTNSITSVTVPTKEGYSFEGYYTSTNGGGTNIINSSGTIIVANNYFSANTTLYAKWVECGNGSYCTGGVKTACPAGKYGNGSTTATTEQEACTVCEKGYYCEGGASRVGCGNGKYNPLEAQTSSSVCSKITAGCFGINGISSCPDSCMGRTTYSAIGSASCSNVSAGYYSTGCDEDGNKCTGQSQCVAGTYCEDGESKECGDGKYSSSAGATACSKITAGCYGSNATEACPNSCMGRTTYSAAGSASCSDVSTGYYSTGCDEDGNKCTGQKQCAAGNYCVNGVSKKCATYYTSEAGATACYDNTTPTINVWADTKFQSVLKSTGKLCALGSDTGSGLKKMEYYTTCNETHKTSTITSGCAEFTITTCENAKFYYRIKDAHNWSAWKNTSKFGAYFIIAREYNNLLGFVNASNNSTNIGFHVGKIEGTDLGTVLINIGKTAVNDTSINNTNLVKRLYTGILGREGTDSEVSGHVTRMNNGRTRLQILTDFVNSTEAKNYRAKWGYT